MIAYTTVGSNDLPKAIAFYKELLEGIFGAKVFFEGEGGTGWSVSPDKPISQKPAEVRMGNGKGNPEYFVAEIVPGKVLYEMDGVDETLAREAFRLAAAKLPFRTTFVHRTLG